METQYNQNSEIQPEPQKSYDKFIEHHKRGRIIAGLFIIAVGAILLAKQAGVNIPHWFLSWPMILIALGIYVGVRHAFRGPGWFILVVLGSVFLIEQIDPFNDIDIENYVWPVAIIVIGLIIIFRPKRSKHEHEWYNATTTSNSPQSSDDMLDSVTVFGGTKKNIISKTFRGGEIVTVFGSTELNLTQADVEGRIEIELVQIFAGAKLIVPPHWKIQTQEVVCIFGGLDDKRPPNRDSSHDENKVLILKGVCLFGGIDIKSF